MNQSARFNYGISPALPCVYERRECPVVALNDSASSSISERRRYDEMSHHLEAACSPEQHSLASALELSQFYRAIIPRWHFAMLNDFGRNHAFAEAIRNAVVPDCLVLDIGAGSGLLALLAARYGAQQVISCELVLPLAHLAQEIVTVNGFADRIQIVPKLSTELTVGVELPRKADLLVTEIVDCGLLGEGLIPTIRHAREHLLCPSGVMIPRAGRIFAALLESEQIYQLNRVDSVCNLDLRLFNRFSTLGYFPVRLNTWRHRLLTKPYEVFSFDFLHDPLQPIECELDMTAVSSGRCHGVVFWFELDLDEQISITNDPYNFATHWMQAMQCFPEPFDMRKGQKVSINAILTDTLVWFSLR